MSSWSSWPFLQQEHSASWSPTPLSLLTLWDFWLRIKLQLDKALNKSLITLKLKADHLVPWNNDMTNMKAVCILKIGLIFKYWYTFKLGYSLVRKPNNLLRIHTAWNFAYLMLHEFRIDLKVRYIDSHYCIKCISLKVKNLIIGLKIREISRCAATTIHQ